jgi:hypothetical protein
MREMKGGGEEKALEMAEEREERFVLRSVNVSIN